MNTFLSIVAADLYGKFNGNFEKLTIVFPNKRASLFFNQQLAAMADKPLWTPRYTTISELFQSMADLTIADPILLTCMLYKIYKQQTGSDETLDHFYSWGETLLNDFQDIDNNLVRADLLFHNVEDLYNLTDFDFLTERQTAAIKQFFHNFDPEKKTKLKNRFLTFWQHILHIYQAFRKELKDKGMAYDGMLKREVVENIVDKPLDEGQAYAFVGFNVLGKAERKLFQQMREQYRTLFYWDFDHAYLDNNTEAGRFIRENIKSFGNELPLDHPCYDQLKTPKDITYIESPTESAQCSVVEKWLRETTGGKPAGTQHAIVLCNESLLQSVLHNIPEQQTINVTMGYPMAQTAVSSLLTTLLDLQLYGQAGKGTWRFLQASRVLQHPFTRHMDTEGQTTAILTQMRKHNTLYPSTDELAQNEWLRTTFTPVRNTSELLKYLAEIVEQTGRAYKDSDEPLQKEAIFKAYTTLSRLMQIDESKLLDITTETLAHLLRQILQNQTIPFHGEPAQGLQVMGVLETRNLDFTHVLMLSVNEGNLPKNDRRTSFIPYNLREAHGMTTIEKQNSLYAYYFYRLIQRAEHVTLTYNSSTEGMSKGEMTRYMMQLLVDYPHLNIKKQILTAENKPLDIKPLQVEKTQKAINILKEKYDLRTNPQAKILSPSAINTYIDCPLQFYLRYVAGLNPADEVSEDIGNDMFGTLFHHCMEQIYGGEVFQKGQPIESQQLYALSQNRELLRRLADDAFNKEYFKRPDNTQKPRYTGQQLLNREVIVNYVQRQLRHDMKHCPLTIVDVEDSTHSATIQTTTGEQLKLGGIIDRIDIVTTDKGTTQKRIVDYKTSNKTQKKATVEQLFSREEKDRSYHQLQTLYYTYIMAAEGNESHMQPTLMYVKPLKETTIDCQGNGEDTLQLFQEQLIQLVNNIFSPEIPFTQTSNPHPCQWCDYAGLCQKNFQNNDD